MLLKKGDSVLVVNELVRINLDDRSEQVAELAILAPSFNECLMVDQARAARLRVNQALKLRHINQASASVVRRDLFQVVKLVVHCQILRLMEEELASLFGQVPIVWKRSRLVIARVHWNVRCECVILDDEEGDLTRVDRAAFLANCVTDENVVNERRRVPLDLVV